MKPLDNPEQLYSQNMSPSPQSNNRLSLPMVGRVQPVPNQDHHRLPSLNVSHDSTYGVQPGDEESPKRPRLSEMESMEDQYIK